MYDSMFNAINPNTTKPIIVPILITYPHIFLTISYMNFTSNTILAFLFAFSYGNFWW